MRRRNGIGLILVLGLLVTVLIGGAATAGGDPLVGTWHERDGGKSNSFYFVDDPVGEVFHVLYYDDATFITVCDDSGPILWAGFGKKIGPNTLEGTFGEYWCPNNGDGVKTELLALNPFGFTLVYDPDTDTITGVGTCGGTRQPRITSVAKAIQELEKGKYPSNQVPALPGVDCDESWRG